MPQKHIAALDRRGAALGFRNWTTDNSELESLVHKFARFVTENVVKICATVFARHAALCCGRVMSHAKRRGKKWST
jgi:hypothetical protein